MSQLLRNRFQTFMPYNVRHVVIGTFCMFVYCLITEISSVSTAW